MPPRRAAINNDIASQSPTSTQLSVSLSSPSQPHTQTVINASASQADASAAAAAKKRGGRLSGAKNYTSAEVTELLRLIELHLPLGSDAWEVVAAHYNTKFPDRQRDGESIKTKYHRIRDTPKQSGSAEYPADTAKARLIEEKIKAKEAQIEVGGEQKVALYHYEDSRDEDTQNTAEPPSPSPSQSSSEISTTNSTSSSRYNLVHGAAAVRQKRKRMETIIESIAERLNENKTSDQSLIERLAKMEENLSNQQSKYAAESAARQQQSDELFVKLTETLALITENLKKKKN